jgi:U3 small nucleolar RNA-associated protein 20
LTEDLGTQIVKNLFYIGKCFYFIPPSEDVSDIAEETEQSREAEEHDEEETEEHDGEEKLNDSNGVKAPKSSMSWLFNKQSFLARGAAIRGQKNILLVSHVSNCNNVSLTDTSNIFYQFL